VDVKVEVKSIHLSPSSNTQGRPSVGAYASSASMVAPDPSKVPHPCFYDDFDDGELDHWFYEKMFLIWWISNIILLDDYVDERVHALWYNQVVVDYTNTIQLCIFYDMIIFETDNQQRLDSFI